jgi:hypothetical protein
MWLHLHRVQVVVATLRSTLRLSQATLLLPLLHLSMVVLLLLNLPGINNDLQWVPFPTVSPAAATDDFLLISSREPSPVVHPAASGAARSVLGKLNNKPHCLADLTFDSESIQGCSVLTNSSYALGTEALPVIMELVFPSFNLPTTSQRCNLTLSTRH